MISANEARELAKKTNQESKQFNDVNNIILSAAKKGEYKVWVYFSIHKDVRDKLNSMGYNVGKEQFDRNESLTEITWNETKQDLDYRIELNE